MCPALGPSQLLWKYACLAAADPAHLPQDAVRLCTSQGEEFARALINYSHEEVAKVQASGPCCRPGTHAQPRLRGCQRCCGRILWQDLRDYGLVCLLASHCLAPPVPLHPLQGLSSKEFAVALGYNGQEEICHRANICLLVAHHDDSDAGGRVAHPGEWLHVAHLDCWGFCWPRCSRTVVCKKTRKLECHGCLAE